MALPGPSWGWNARSKWLLLGAKLSRCHLRSLVDISRSASWQEKHRLLFPILHLLRFIVKDGVRGQEHVILAFDDVLPFAHDWLYSGNLEGLTHDILGGIWGHSTSIRVIQILYWWCGRWINILDHVSISQVKGLQVTTRSGLFRSQLLSLIAIIEFQRRWGCCALIEHLFIDG